MRIADQDCGLLFKRGSLKKILGPGFYFVPGAEIEAHRRRGRFSSTEVDIALLEKAQDAAEYLEFKDVEEGYICLVFEDRLYRECLKAGRYAYWKGLHK